MSSDSQKLNEFKSIVRTKLGATTIDKLPKPLKPLTFIEPDQELKDAFKVLISNKILSAPVKRNGHGYEGFLDVMHLAASVVSIYDSRRDHSANIDLEDIVTHIRHHGNKGSGDNLDVWTPAYMARIQPIRSVPPTANLLDVCKELSKSVHRVAVVNSEGEIIRIISQSFLIDSLHQLLQEVESHANDGSHTFSSLPISALGITPKSVWTCKSTAPAIDAFKMMIAHHVSGISITDDQGHFVGQITAHNLNRFLETRKIEDLNKSVADFVLQNPGGSDSTANVITMNTPVHTVFEKFAGARSHRCFIVNDENILVGVCSLKDILIAILRD